MPYDIWLCKSGCLCYLYKLNLNLIYQLLLKSPEVEYCGYSIPHPSEDRLNIRVQTTGKQYY